MNSSTLACIFGIVAVWRLRSQGGISHHWQEFGPDVVTSASPSESPSESKTQLLTCFPLAPALGRAASRWWKLWPVQSAHTCSCMLSVEKSASPASRPRSVFPLEFPPVRRNLHAHAHALAQLHLLGRDLRTSRRWPLGAAVSPPPAVGAEAVEPWVDESLSDGWNKEVITALLRSCMITQMLIQLLMTSTVGASTAI